MVYLGLGLLPQVDDALLSLNRILGWATWPFTVLMGLRPEEWQTASQILGARFVETEVAAYFKLAAVQGTNSLFPRSLVVMTYALCGFVHIASMGIFVGGLSALIPSRIQDNSLLGFRALWTAFLATVLTGCIAGVLAWSGSGRKSRPQMPYEGRSYNDHSNKDHNDGVTFLFLFFFKFIFIFRLVHSGKHPNRS